MYKHENFANVPVFRNGEIITGSFLRAGEFSNVFTIESILLGLDQDRIFFDVEENSSDTHWKDENVNGFQSLVSSVSRHQIAKNCELEARDQRFAVKYLRPEILDDKELLEDAMRDFKNEISILCSTDHKNIIQVHGISPDDGTNGKLFFIMDKLEETLEIRELKWKRLHEKFSNNKKVLSTLLVERLRVATDIASAFTYLHKKRIIYRDLKPENIGFDVFGTVKLFDFGMAKDVSKMHSNPDGTYNLTGGVGTTRYMAPEVLLGFPYTFSADVFSFSLLLWQICALKVPYTDHQTVWEHAERMVLDADRPPLLTSFPPPLCNLIAQCWSQRKMDRANFEYILKYLSLYINQHALVKRRKSFISLSSSRLYTPLQQAPRRRSFFARS